MSYCKDGLIRANEAGGALNMSESAFRAAFTAGRFPKGFRFGSSRLWRVIDIVSIGRCMGLTVNVCAFPSNNELTVEDMAQITQLSESTVWRYVDIRKIPDPIQRNRRSYYWERATVIGWLNEMGCVGNHLTYLTYKDVAEMAHITIPTVHQAVENRKLREPFRLARSVKGFKMSDVKEFLEILRPSGDII